MTNQDYIDALSDYNFRACNETFEECPIEITSVEDIQGEDAKLVRFIFGHYKESCVAIFYNDGTYFTPFDWQDPEWDNEEWKIEDTEWNDSRIMTAIMFNGMPRVLA